jgi:leader peptidase (prepilin peptidase) / N-methyltransferase
VSLFAAATSILHHHPQVQLILAIMSFFLGASVGSFLNVVIYRLPIGLSVNDPKRSFCPKCKYQIPYWHNIPIFSWLLLRGKCKNCGVKISPRYVFVELFTAFIFLMTFLWFRDTPYHYVPLWIFFSLCIAATYIDFDHMIIPDEINWGGTVAGIVCSALVPHFHVVGPWWKNLLLSVIGAAAGYALLFLVVQLGKLAFGRLRHAFATPQPFSVSQPDENANPLVVIGPHQYSWEDIFYRPTDKLKITCQNLLINDEPVEADQLILKENTLQWSHGTQPASQRSLEEVLKLSGTTTLAVIPREAMGFGDVKFMCLVGAFLGWKGVLMTLLLASVIGTLVAIIMTLLRKREWAARIPFGPYLALGAALFAFYGPVIINWYWSLSKSGTP